MGPEYVRATPNLAVRVGNTQSALVKLKVGNQTKANYENNIPCLFPGRRILEDL